MLGSTSLQSKPSSTVAPHQIHCLTLLYTRLPILVFVPVGAALLMPLVFMLLNSISLGHAVHTIVLTAAITKGGNMLIHKYVSDDEQRLQEALERNEIKLPMIGLILSVLFFRSFVSFVLGDRISWYISKWDLMVFFGRLACALFLIQLGVFIRYFSPLSIMRCSSVPLVSNPFESNLWYLIRFPGTIFQPDETPPPNHPFFPSNEDIGRRYQHPSFSSTAMQVSVNVCLGCVLFYATFGPANDGGSASLAACLLVTLGPLLIYVRQNNHEIDPRPYVGISSTWSFNAIFDRIGETTAVASLIVVASLAVEYLVTPDLGFSWSFVFELFLFTASSLSYQNMWEESLRLLLFYPMDDITHSWLAMFGFSYADCVGAMLLCLLVDTSLVNEICKSPSQQNRVVFEKAELDQIRSLCEEYGRQLTTKLSGYVEAPMEEDVIRFGILEALGGQSEDYNRHKRILDSWLNALAPAPHGGSFHEPPCATLVRGLCVVIGGTGNVLLDIYQKYERRFPKLTWQLSIGGLVSLTYSLVALARFLEPRTDVSIKESARTAQQLNVMVPAALASVFTLFKGLDLYRNKQGGMLHPPDLLQSVLRTCEVSAAKISTRLATGGPAVLVARAANLPLENEVLQWLKRTQDLLVSEASLTTKTD